MKDQSELQKLFFKTILYSLDQKSVTSIHFVAYLDEKKKKRLKGETTVLFSANHLFLCFCYIQEINFAFPVMTCYLTVS